MTFAQPSQGGNDGAKFEPKEHKGSLLLVYPKNYQPSIMTKASKDPTSAADADIIVVDKFGPDGRPLSFIGARIFGNLANSVRNDVGGQVLGRLDQIETQGGRTPWVLQNFTDQDAAAAGPVHAAYQQGQFRPTPNPMQSPASAAPTSPAWQPTPTPPQQQWNPTPAPPAAPVYAQQVPPTAPAWNTPAPAAPVPAPPATPAPAGTAVDPNVLAVLAQNGITPPPGTSAEQIMAVYATLQPANQPPF